MLDQPKPADQGSSTKPQAIPSKPGFFGWVASLGSPPLGPSSAASAASSAKPLNLPSSAPPLGSTPGADSSAIAPETEPVASAAAKRLARKNSARKDSSSLTHDEALNISRAGSAFSPPPPAPGAQAMTGRPRSNSKYDKLGLMAAYSGGPSSF